MKAKKLTYIALMTSIICILSPISIPITGYVPISLATFVVMLTGVLFGPMIGSMATILYILLGVIGLPVFASYSSGIGVVVGVTGGYIIGYIPLAYISGLAGKVSKQLNSKKRMLVNMSGMIAGTIILYIIGTIYFEYLMALPLKAALMACVIPFLPGDLIKTVAVCLLNEKLQHYIKM